MAHAARFGPERTTKWSWYLGGLGMLLFLAGCESAVSPGSTAPKTGPAGTVKAGPSGALKTGGNVGSPDVSGASKSQAKIMSKIEGDRMTVVSTPVVLSKQTESSPFRFTEVSKEWGIDFVHFSGMVDEKHFPTANGSGVAIFDYD